MMQTAKHTFHSIGDRGGDLVKTVGSGTAGLARRFGNGTASLARQVGIKRGLIGLAVLAAAVGGSVVVVRYLRARNADRGFGSDELGSEDTAARSRNRARAQRPADAQASRQP